MTLTHFLNKRMDEQMYAYMNKKQTYRNKTKHTQFQMNLYPQ